MYLNVSYSLRSPTMPFLALGPSGSGIVSRLKALIEKPNCPSGWPLAVPSSLRTPCQTNFGEMGGRNHQSLEPQGAVFHEPTKRGEKVGLGFYVCRINQ